MPGEVKCRPCNDTGTMSDGGGCDWCDVIATVEQFRELAVDAGAHQVRVESFWDASVERHTVVAQRHVSPHRRTEHAGTDLHTVLNAAAADVRQWTKETP